MSDRDDINRLRDERDAQRWRKLIRLVGYPQDGSDTTVTLFWDDATDTPFIRIGKNKPFYTEHGNFASVIDSIHEDEFVIVPEYSPSESERDHAVAMFVAYDALRREGWQEIVYAPKDTQLWLIEAGSSGFHAGFRDDDGSFWIVDRTDTWPSHPVLFKLQDECPS